MVDGWFSAGDIATRDADGYFFLVDRKKDMIFRGGYITFARARVEEVLYRHDAVAEAAVIGVPDEHYVEEVKAVVLLKPGTEAGEAEIIDICKSKLAACKYPSTVEIRESLSKGATGKFLKRELWKGKVVNNARADAVLSAKSSDHAR